MFASVHLGLRSKKKGKQKSREAKKHKSRKTEKKNRSRESKHVKYPSVRKHLQSLSSLPKASVLCHVPQSVQTKGQHLTLVRSNSHCTLPTSDIVVLALRGTPGSRPFATAALQRKETTFKIVEHLSGTLPLQS